MRVRARKADPATAPESIRHDVSTARVTSDVEYEVHTLAVLYGDVYLLVVDDGGTQSWLPAWGFDQVDASIPPDWVCTALHEGPELMLGPDFIAGNWATYTAFREGEPEPIRRFWARFDTLRAERETAIPELWREFGFYFTFDVEQRRWLIAGSRTGILKFCQMLTDYASVARRQDIPAFQRYGPRQDFKLVTAKSPQVRRDGLHGRPEDFERLANVISDTLPSGQTVILLAGPFMQRLEFRQIELELHVGPDDFDPGVDGPQARATHR
jgi:hypothetical protein